MKFNIKEYQTDPRWQYKFTELQNDPNWYLPNAYVNLLYQQRESIADIASLTEAIETGTHNGGTTEYLAEHFDRVFTVEKYPDTNPYGERNLIEIYREIHERHPCVEFLSGDSADMLKRVLIDNPDTRFFMFLDAHYPGWTNIVNELRAIKRYSRNKNHVIIIDDCNELDTRGWPSRVELDNLLLNINEEYTIKKLPIIRNIFAIGAWCE